MKILLSVSSYGWAFHHIAQQLVKNISDHCFEIGTLADHKQGSEYDLTVSFYWDDIDRILSKVKTKRSIVTVYDHESWKGPRKEQILKSFSRANAIITGNQRISEGLYNLGIKKPMFCCPDGVDTNLFTPYDYPRSFTVGWTGNERARGNDFKGANLIREAATLSQVPLKIQEYRTKIAQTEMPEKFYKHISAYICASISEGTPNPVLEALSSGRPVITTRVGLTSEIIKPGINGLFIDRNVQSITSAILQVKQWDLESRKNLCRNSLLGRNWKEASNTWNQVFSEVQHSCYE